MDTVNLIVSIIGIVLDAVLATIAIVISVKAIHQTKEQIALSNKHQLFDRRLEAYSAIKAVINSYLVAKGLCKKSDDLDNQIRTRSVLQQFFENSFMNDAVSAIDNPQDYNAYETVNIKAQWLEFVSEEISVIFEGEEAILVSDFIFQISLLVFNLNHLNYWQCYEEEADRQAQFKQEIFKLFQSSTLIHQQIEKTDAVKKLLEQIKL